MQLLRAGLCVPRDSVHGSNACHGLYSLCVWCVQRDSRWFEGPESPKCPVANPSHRMSRRCRKSVTMMSQWCREMSQKCHKNVMDLSRAVTKCHKASQPRTSPDISRRGWPPLPPRAQPPPPPPWRPPHGSVAAHGVDARLEPWMSDCRTLSDAVGQMSDTVRGVSDCRMSDAIGRMVRPSWCPAC